MMNRGWPILDYSAGLLVLRSPWQLGAVLELGLGDEFILPPPLVLLANGWLLKHSRLYTVSRVYCVHSII